MYHLYINDIPLEGKCLVGDSGELPWLAEVATQASGAAELAQGELLRADLNIYCSEANHVDIMGALEWTRPSQCDRCSQDYVACHHIPVSLFLVPADDDWGEAQEDSAGEVSLSSYRDKKIPLQAVLAEQLELSRPMRQLCSQDCKGICGSCGVNLNLQSCGCA